MYNVSIQGGIGVKISKHSLILNYINNKVLIMSRNRSLNTRYKYICVCAKCPECQDFNKYLLWVNEILYLQYIIMPIPPVEG